MRSFLIEQNLRFQLFHPLEQSLLLQLRFTC